MNRILLFAGAGISAESGLATFREQGGLWTRFDVNEVCNFTTFRLAKNDAKARAHIFEFYTLVRESINQAQPNGAHKQVAMWQKEFGVERVKIVTANIDDLFERAGCQEVIHIHGNAKKMHCVACAHRWEVNDYNHEERCPKCASRLTKPDVVFFGERAPEYLTMNQIFNDRRRLTNDVLLYVGSSQSVIPPSRLIENNRSHAQTVLVNKDVGEEDKLFHHRYYGLASEQLGIVDKQVIENFFRKT